MKARVLIRLKPSILDVQGKAIEKSLAQLGAGAVDGVRVGKMIEIPIPTARKHDASAFVEELCSAVLASPITEDYEFELVS